MTPDAAHHFFILAILVLATVVLIVAMRSFTVARHGRAAQSGAAALEAVHSDLGEMKARLAAVETMLREVG